MSPINDVEIPNITIPNVVSSQHWLNGVPFVPSNDPPVTLQIGFPIVEIPGCVKMHKDNEDKISRLPFDKDLVNQASTVTALAVVATAGAAATPLLIRVIRPVIKKIWTTIQKKLGKEVRQLSKSEIETNKYREKKGLPPIKRK